MASFYSSVKIIIKMISLLIIIEENVYKHNNITFYITCFYNIKNYLIIKKYLGHYNHKILLFSFSLLLYASKPFYTSKKIHI